MHPLIADFINGIDPSPPSGWMEDFHLQAVVHTRRTRKAPPKRGKDYPGRKIKMKKPALTRKSRLF
jgi:hypothetical protein